MFYYNGGMLEILEQILDHNLFPAATVILVVAAIMLAYSLATRKNRFEEQLATSKVNSITVGLVEIVGNVSAIKQCEIPLFKRGCVGYSYKIERIKRDSDSHRDSYFTKYTENHIEPFFIEDDTGRVLIDPDGLMADNLPQDYEYLTNYRHTCSYLTEGDKVMVIGRAQQHDGKLTVQRDAQNNIFSLTPYDAVVEDRAMKPFMSRLFLYLLVAAVLTALILFY